RQLMQDFGMFMAEKSIVTDLYNVLGKEVYKKRREPIPIDLHKPDLQKEVLRTAKSTYMNFHTGSCYAVKIATTGQDDKIAFENFMSAYDKIVAATPGGYDNIRSFQIKTANSISLPIYDVKTDHVDHYEEEDEQEDDLLK
ncbi:Ribosomal L1 domain-containing protein 1, partial [Rhizopus stolonifer]